MKNIFMCLSISFSLFFSSLALAQKKQDLQCSKVVKFYPVYMTCVGGTKARPLFYSIEISTPLVPYGCGALPFSRDAAITVSDLSGKILNALVMKPNEYIYEVTDKGAFFASVIYSLNLYKCLVDQSSGQGGFSVGN